ncbi:hypothetical protein ACQVTS_32725 [Bacillus mycoides]|uniref:hypothetical protein n=1 Tax=Bacillus mycoides TaxID=1405 RepID=UPI003D658381
MNHSSVKLNNCIKDGVLFSPANGLCCPKPTINITDDCESFEVLDTTLPVIIFNSPSNSDLMAVSFYVDQYTAGSQNTGLNGGANFAVTAGGTTTTYRVQNGCTTTVIDANITTITVQSFIPANPLTARVCYRFYKKSFL